MSLRTIGICAGLLMAIGQGSPLAAQSLSPNSFAAGNGPFRPASNYSPTDMAQSQSASLPRSIARRVQRDLASRLNVSPERLQIVEATPQTWPDQCLGLGRPNQRCMGDDVSGWQIQVVSAQQMWTYRSDRIGRRLKLEPLTAAPDFGTGDFSAETSQRLLQTVAEQVNQPIERLEVLEVQAATWDGCLGVYEPDMACTAIAWAGFRTLITDGETLWVYHLNETGEHIAQNGTASGVGNALTVSFAPIDGEPEPADPQIVFQSQLSGDLAGSVQKTVLTADGKLYREQSRYLDGGQTTREELGTLSPEAVQAFRELLEQHRFANFHRLRYLTEAAFADYPTTRLQTGYVGVEYIDLEVNNLPPDLQAIIAAWNALN